MDAPTSVNDQLPASVLDDPIGNGLRSAHSRLAVSVGSAIRYPADVGPFCSVGLEPTAETWASLRELIDGPGGALFMAPGFEAPDAVTTVMRIPLSQMVFEGELPERSTTVTRELGPHDVPEMMRLTSLTEPGPFAEATINFGGYVGIFDGDALVAMAGRRMSPPGFIEVSAVCTDPAYRGRGYARTVVEQVLRGIHAEGDGAFLHVARGNPARNLYEAMGFVVRRDFEVLVLAGESNSRVA
jgi:ribosomal protein S18 acetylase RimI-like enzyme